MFTPTALLTVFEPQYKTHTRAASETMLVGNISLANVLLFAINSKLSRLDFMQNLINVANVNWSVSVDRIGYFNVVKCSIMELVNFAY